MLSRLLTAAVIGVVAWVISDPLARSVAGDKPSDNGFKPIFNGKDLTGWKYYKEDLTGKTETSDKRFAVVDGAIVANEGKGIKDLYTVAEFNKSFILKLEFRAGPKADSGVYIRGPQLQVRDFIRRGEQKQLEKVFKNDDWNELEITVINDVVSTIFNGKTITEKDKLEVLVENGVPSVKLNGSAAELSKLEIVKAPKAICKLGGLVFDPGYKPGPKGGIGLQAETGKFEYRNLRIKELN
jgi:hypothetical protein